MTAAGTSNALRATCSELDALSSSQHLTKLPLNYFCSELEKKIATAFVGMRQTVTVASL